MIVVLFAACRGFHRLSRFLGFSSCMGFVLHACTCMFSWIPTSFIKAIMNHSFAGIYPGLRAPRRCNLALGAGRFSSSEGTPSSSLRSYLTVCQPITHVTYIMNYMIVQTCLCAGTCSLVHVFLMQTHSELMIRTIASQGQSFGHHFLGTWHEAIGLPCEIH